jgi:restriction system protein
MIRLGCLLLLLLVPVTSEAQDLLHTIAPVYGCSDPHATWSINRKADPRRVASARPDNRCFAVSPAERWEKIVARNGLLLLRRLPAMTGEPPLFFRPGDVAPVPAPVTVPGPAGATIRRDSGYGPALALMLVVGVVAAGLVSTGVAARWMIGRRRRRALDVATAEIATQRQRLQIKKLQLVGTDDYGTPDERKWQQEKGYFCKTRLLPLLSSARLEDQWTAIATEVDRRIERAASGPPAGETATGQFVSDPQRFDPRMNPIDYERHCAMLLRSSGWTAQVTVASGDQGADVLARRGGKLLVVQCKLYRNAVGNAAVQQVSAARLHQRAQFAAVVSNARFTAAARQLARTNGVHLLHHEELRTFRPA